jgi:hypothetical protein
MNVGVDAPPSVQDAAVLNRIIFGNNAAMAGDFEAFAHPLVREHSVPKEMFRRGALVAERAGVRMSKVLGQERIDVGTGCQNRNGQIHTCREGVYCRVYRQPPTVRSIEKRTHECYIGFTASTQQRMRNTRPHLRHYRAWLCVDCNLSHIDSTCLELYMILAATYIFGVNCLNGSIFPVALLFWIDNNWVSIPLRGFQLSLSRAVVVGTAPPEFPERSSRAMALLRAKFGDDVLAYFVDEFPGLVSNGFTCKDVSDRLQRPRDVEVVFEYP